MDLRLVITDIDGVWTDGSMYYDERGTELKRFNTSDSAGVLFCRLNDIDVAILTGEQTEIVARRAKKLNVRHLYQGVTNKKETAQRLLETLGLTFAQTAFIGDDINDIPLLQAVGYAGTVPHAPDYVKRYATYVTHRDGGAGAFRDFVEHLLRQRGLLEQTIDKYLAQIPSTVGAGGRVAP